MARKKILITREIPDEGVKMLKKKFDVDIYPHDRPIPRRELIKRLQSKRYDALLSILTDNIDAKVLDAAGGQLMVVANYAVGYNNIDLEAAKERKVIITNTPGPEISESVAEHTIALMFGLAHRIVEGDDYARAGRYKYWGPQLLLGSDIVNKTVGIVGMGRIGSSIAKRLHDGFGVKILYTNRSNNKDAEKQFGAKRVSLNELLKRSDFVTLHVPLLPETHHLIGAKQLKMMKKTAFLINTSRGPVVDEKALIAALKKQSIGGAALDVYEFEPKIPYALRTLSNVISTPHTASATIETRQSMSRRAAENIIAVLSGKKPKNKVV
ncbi:D-glycerate dehydrogenase [Candidatus Uhrbacteria bacterium]|jgi:glyoxylate reductase|nr:D-glycerate dehydrogenase [Candidatus Uhrbacteria bacterium]